MSSLITPEKLGNASMADLKGEAYKAKLEDPNWVNSINKMFGSNLTKSDLLKIAAVTGGGIAGLTSLNQPNIKKVGYQGTIPKMTAVRNMQTAPDPMTGRPGAGGTLYGGDVQYYEKGKEPEQRSTGLDDSKVDPLVQAYKKEGPVAPPTPKAAFGGSGSGLGYKTISEAAFGKKPEAAKQAQTPTLPPGMGDTPVPNWTVPAAKTPWEIAMETGPQQPQTAPAVMPKIPGSNPKDFFDSQGNPMQVMYAQGGIAGLAHGGRYLQGPTDGMADKLHTSIDGKQPAALSHGEFVIPADVVSHLGNGNSDAGAQKLYSMMDKIRMARTGTKKQGKHINPDKFMPGGLAAAYAEGGSVMGFAGESGSYVPAGTTGVDQTLAGWTGDYIPNMLAKTEALTNAPYQQYTGPLTAGESSLQTKAFDTAGNLQTPSSIGTAAETAGNIANRASELGYTPQTADFGTADAQRYMSPYLQASLNPQLEEARRQSQITQQLNNAQMTKAGAFGGSASGIMNRETQRSLGSNLANITGQGYNTAYNNAMAQFNADQNRKMQENQFGANYANTALNTGLAAANAQGNLGVAENQVGINNLNAQANLGAQQRGITSEGIAADKKQFEEARDNPYNQLKFQQSMLNGLPIQATNYETAQPSTLSQIASGATTVDKALSTLGVK